MRESRTSMSYKPVQIQPLDPIQKTINQNPYRNVDGTRSKLVAQGLRPRVDVDMVRGITHIPKSDDTLPKFANSPVDTESAGAIAATGAATTAEGASSKAASTPTLPEAGPDLASTPAADNAALAAQAPERDSVLANAPTGPVGQNPIAEIAAQPEQPTPNAANGSNPGQEPVFGRGRPRSNIPANGPGSHRGPRPCRSN